MECVNNGVRNDMNGDLKKLEAISCASRGSPLQYAGYQLAD